MSGAPETRVDPEHELLAAADRGARTLRTRPPSVADLESRARRRTAGATALALGALVAGLAASQSALRGHRPAGTPADSPAATTSEALADAGRAIERTLDAALAPSAPTLPSVAEIRALDDARRSTSASFRALFRAAEGGDARALDDLRWLAEHFPDDHDGRCARAYLASRAAAPTEGPEER